MLKDWVWPALWMLLKFTFACAVLTGVWLASALYHREYFEKSADARIQIRVHRECLRPDFVQTVQAAREYDLTTDELALVQDKLGLLNRRMGYLLDETDRIEALRLEVTQGKVRSAPGGMGGPAPNPKRKE